MQFGALNLHIIRESTFKLDGGAMYGVVPKALWSKQAPSDALNRVPLACNLLFIDTGVHKVLVETGMGDRWSDIDRERYQLTTHAAPDTVLEGVGLRAEDIDYVIISHLHFDHVGGAVKSIDGKLMPTYPRARHIIQRGEWDFAFKANARARASYRPDDFVPLMDAGLVDLVDGDHVVCPGVEVRMTGGHTSHHQIVYFESQGKSGVYFADIMPTASHLSPPWVMGYDHYPLESCDIKSKWLEFAAAHDYLVVFDHETGVPWGKVSISDKAKYAFTPLAQSTLEMPGRVGAYAD